MKKTWNVLLALACAPFIVSAGETTAPKPGEPPPPFGLESTLQAPRGAQPSWKALKGKVVVLEFWATWCGPCIAAIPHLNELADKFKDEPVQFIAITDQDETVVRPFLRKKPMHAWIGFGHRQVDVQRFRDQGHPAHGGGDQNGIIAAITYPTYLAEQQLKYLLAGKQMTLAQRGTEGGLFPGQVPAISKREREPLFQVIIRPSTGGPMTSSSSQGGLTASRVTILNILSSSSGISPFADLHRFGPARRRLRFYHQNARYRKRKGSDLAAASGGIDVQASVPAIETSEMDAFVLKPGQPTEHLTPTVATGSSSLSSGGGSLNCVNQSMTSLASSLEEI